MSMEKYSRITHLMGVRTSGEGAGEITIMSSFHLWTVSPVMINMTVT